MGPEKVASDDFNGQLSWKILQYHILQALSDSRGDAYEILDVWDEVVSMEDDFVRNWGVSELQKEYERAWLSYVHGIKGWISDSAWDNSSSCSRRLDRGSKQNFEWKIWERLASKANCYLCPKSYGHCNHTSPKSYLPVYSASLRVQILPVTI